MKTCYSSLMFVLLSMPALALSVNVEEPRTITADKIEYDLKTETIKTSGDTEIVNASGQRMTLVDSYISQQGEELSGSESQ